VVTDAELIGRSLAGDGESFVEMISRHETVVGAYLHRRVSQWVAEELLAEVWIAAFTSRGTYDCTYDDARPWLFGVARNTLRRHWRNGRPEDLVADLDDLALGSDPWPAVDDRVDGAAVLRSALAHLRPNQREVLTLVVWEELSVADAARTLGIPAGTARHALHQARLSLRDQPAVTALLNESNDMNNYVKECK
jgi:RNA polymerase sigma factor (sigma-70 family)